MPREPYDPKFLVERKQILADLRKWTTYPLLPNHLLLITACSGAGKTWIIYHLRDKLLQEKQCVFMLDLRLLNTTVPPLSLENFLRQEMEKWFNTARELCCPNVREFLSERKLEANLDILVEDLCQNCQPDKPPVLLVDGFEEIAQDERHRVEESIIKRFLGRSCTGVLMALRDPACVKNSWLRRQTGAPFNLDLLNTKEAREQYRKRGQDILSQLSLFVAPYEFDHPLLNICLYEQAIKQGVTTASDSSALLELDSIRDCLQEMLRPVASDGKLDGLVELLIQAACLKDSNQEFLDNWSPEEYRSIVGEPYWPRLEPLYQHGLIETNGRFRQVTQGVRQLARAYGSKRFNAQESDKS